jgi:GAF domain-containing protein
MEPFSSREHASWATGTPASTNLLSNVRFPEEDGGYSLAEMARRDLDAALQLLVDRAQYITGASGAAIALRRSGKNDMQCRASTGSNAPELGALLSTEFGLSGESVRTRQPLRCDDAERDARVNRDVCRHLGIASVVVMPVVNDDEVLGVFELFSGEVNAFGERDLSAVQRLSEMVETAVRLAEAAENLPEWLRTAGISPPAVADAAVEEDKILEGPDLETLAAEELVSNNLVAEELVLEDVVLEEPKPALKVAAQASAEKTELDTPAGEAYAAHGASAEPLNPKIPTPLTRSGQALSQKTLENETPIIHGTVTAAPEPPKAVIPEAVAAATQAPTPRTEPVPSAESVPSKNQLFWSAALNPAADVAKPAEVDQSHVPPVLRNLHKCQACGFPVSAGRVLCVECEEKKWRGQLKVPPRGAPRQTAIPKVAAQVPPAPKAEARVFAAAARSVSAGIPVPSAQRGSAISAVVQTSPAVQPTASKQAEQPAVPATPARNSSGQASKPRAQNSESASPEFVLSAGLEPSQSWLSENKYVLIVLLLVGLVLVGVFVLR